MKAFMMSLEVAQTFYQRCMERNAKTEEERLKIMDELIHEENVKILKNEEALAKELGGKKVLKVTKGAGK